MINLRKTCSKCNGLECCIKTIEDNINNIIFPDKKQSIRCTNFKNLESAVTEHVMDGINKALMNDLGIEATYVAKAYSWDTNELLFEFNMLDDSPIVDPAHDLTVYWQPPKSKYDCLFANKETDK